MSMELANPNLYKRICDGTDDDKESWSNMLNLHRLHPHKFKDACSCSECDGKITRLQGFEKNIIFLGKLNTHHLSKLQDKESLCDALSHTAYTTIRILDMLNKNLKTVYEDAGTPFTLKKSEAASKFENVDKQITELLITAELMNAPEDKHVAVEPNDFSFEINAGIFWYGLTKAKEEAEPRLKQILDIEENNEVERQKMTIDYSVLKKNIERQIEELKMIPVEVLVLEVKELIEQICPRKDHYMMSVKVCQYISDIDAAMSMEKDKFWANYDELNQVKGHSSNDLDKTLDSLIEKVDSFEKEWEKEFASFFTTSYYRSDPKRQRTE